MSRPRRSITLKAVPSQSVPLDRARHLAIVLHTLRAIKAKQKKPQSNDGKNS